MGNSETIQFQADYLVPVYNLGAETAFLTDYNDGVRWVNLWAINAVRGDEQESMKRAIARELTNYKNAQKQHPELSVSARGVYWMETLQRHMAQPVYHKQPDADLEKIVALDLAGNNYQTDMKKALYLEGVSHMRKKTR